MDYSRMNNLPFIAGMRATPRRIVKSFFIATVMGFLVINMNMLLRSVDDDTSFEYACQGDPNCMGHINPHPNGNGVEPIEPQQHPRHFPRNNNNNKPSLPSDNNNNAGSQGNKSKQNQSQPKVQILPNASSDSKNKSGAKSTGVGHVIQDKAPPSDVSNASQVVAPLVKDLLSGPHKPISPQNASFIKDLINKINHDQKIHNLDKWVLLSSPASEGSGKVMFSVVSVHLTQESGAYPIVHGTPVQPLTITACSWGSVEVKYKLVQSWTLRPPPPTNGMNHGVGGQPLSVITSI